MQNPERGEKSDPQLWVNMLNGDEAALAALHGRHYRVLYRYAFKICKDKELALDTLQELFFQLWAKRQSLKAVESVRFYLMKWLKRLLLRALQQNRYELPLEEVNEETLGVALSVEDMITLTDAEQNLKTAIQQALNNLSPREREIIYMRFFLELTYDEICKSLKLSYQVVMNYVHRALKALRRAELLGKIMIWLMLAMTDWNKHFFGGQ